MYVKERDCSRYIYEIVWVNFMIVCVLVCVYNGSLFNIMLVNFEEAHYSNTEFG